jgi:hypothetical protein
MGEGIEKKGEKRMCEEKEDGQKSNSESVRDQCVMQHLSLVTLGLNGGLNVTGCMPDTFVSGVGGWRLQRQ